MQITNCLPNPIPLQCSEFMGFIENVTESERDKLTQVTLTILPQITLKKRVPIPLTKERKIFIQEKVKLNVPEEFKGKYLDVLFKNCKTISEHKYDLGQTETLMHDISLKNSSKLRTLTGSRSKNTSPNGSNLG